MGRRGCGLAWAGMPHYFAGGFLMFLGRKGMEAGGVAVEVGSGGVSAPVRGF